YKRANDAVRKFEEALSELNGNAVLLSFERVEDVRGDRNKIIDIKYSLSPSPEFVKDVKAANKRQKDSQEQITNIR
ncbi:MAG: replication protein, partial [Methylicorpusculum sp.]|nr:replication protein [Methylicorpusculum sp.]